MQKRMMLSSLIWPIHACDGPHKYKDISNTTCPQGQGQGKKEGKPKPSLSNKATVERCLEWSVVCCQIYYCENRQMLLVVQSFASMQHALLQLLPPPPLPFPRAEMVLGEKFRTKLKEYLSCWLESLSHRVLTPDT